MPDFLLTGFLACKNTNKQGGATDFFPEQIKNIPLALIVQYHWNIDALNLCRTIATERDLGFIYQFTLLIDTVNFKEIVGEVDEVRLTAELNRGRRGVFNNQIFRNQTFDALYLLTLENIIQEGRLIS